MIVLLIWWCSIPTILLNMRILTDFRIAITKIDILDTFKEVKIGVAYELDRKKNYDSFPGIHPSISSIRLDYLWIWQWWEILSEPHHVTLVPSHKQ